MEAVVTEQLHQKKLLGKSMLNESLLNVEEDYFSWMLSNKKNKRLLNVANLAWEEYKKVQEQN